MKLLDMRAWNPDVRFDKMSRMQKEDVKALQPGDIAYYINTDDELVGIVYSATVKEVYKNHIELEVFPVLDTIPDGALVLSYIKPHMESFAYTDCCVDTLQYLYKDCVLSEEIEDTFYADRFVL